MKTLLIILLITLTTYACQSQDESLTTLLHPGIYQINNQYFYGERVRTYLVELDDKLLLFDIPTYSRELEAFLRQFEKPVAAILSHGSCGIRDGTKWQATIGLNVYAHRDDQDHPWLRMQPDVWFTEMPHFADQVEVIHTPGHSAGSICVLEKTSKSLFTGDTFYGNEHGEIRDFTRERQADYENLEDRIESCKKLLQYDFENVYPFHYEIIVGNGKRVLRTYLQK